jgi:hypothetical protein
MTTETKLAQLRAASNNEQLLLANKAGFETVGGYLSHLNARKDKEDRLLTKKKAKEAYRIARATNSALYQSLRADAIRVLTNISDTGFNCGELKVGLLK